MKVIFVTSLILILLVSCSQKKYYYKEDGSKEEVIEAENDSLAYAKAYQKFQISKNVHENTTKAFGDFGLNEPTSFHLYDDSRKEIFAMVDEQKIKDDVRKLTDRQGEQIKQTVNNARFKDTIGSNGFPVKIVKATFSREEYSNYKNVSLSYKNISGKKISAIRFRWYGENSFGEPADMTGIVDGWSGGLDDSGLGIGRTGYGTWNVYSNDGKKIVVSFPTEIAFADGTKWTNPN